MRSKPEPDGTINSEIGEETDELKVQESKLNIGEKKERKKWQSY